MQLSFEKTKRYLSSATEIMEMTKSPAELLNYIINENSSALLLIKERRDGLYEYLLNELFPMWSKGFKNYYEKQKG